jgi:HK97 gp10 family phage protein
VDAKLTGAEELTRAMGEIKTSIARKHLRTALRAGAKVIQLQCKADAPVKSGRTRSAIKVRSGKRSRTGIRMLVSIGKSFFKGDTFYAGFVEFGWVPSRKRRSQRKGKARPPRAGEGFVPGERWLHHAFDKSKESAFRTVRESLTASLEEEAAKSSALKA